MVLPIKEQLYLIPLSKESAQKELGIGSDYNPFIGNILGSLSEPLLLGSIGIDVISEAIDGQK